MTNLIDKLFDCFSEFTWRRFFALIVICVLVLISFSLFERYTSSFRLSRLQKSAELIIKIQEMETATANGSPETKKAAKEIIKQTSESIDIRPLSLDILPSTLRLSVDNLWKFLAGAAFWVVIAISMILKVIKGDRLTRSRFSGLLFVAVVAGAFANIIPVLWWPWGHLIIYPLCILVFFYGVIGIPFTLWWCSPMSKKVKEPSSANKTE